MPPDDTAELCAFAARYVAKQVAYMGQSPEEDREGYAVALRLADRGGNADEVRSILGLSPGAVVARVRDDGDHADEALFALTSRRKGR